MRFLMYIYLQHGLLSKKDKSRKQLKERKNRAKKLRGVKKVICIAIVSKFAKYIYINGLLNIMKLILQSKADSKKTGKRRWVSGACLCSQTQSNSLLFIITVVKDNKGL